MHIDMDAFFTSVEQADNPQLKGKPVIVGSDPDNGNGRGVVSAASYEARKYGIKSAMPISKAYKLCPNGIFIRPRMHRYGGISSRIMEIFRKYTPLVEQISVDEAFLDCTGSCALFGTPPEIAKKIKSDIYESTGLTASIGISGNKSISKIASELQKPDGLVLCPPGEEKNFISMLPIGVIWGIGKNSQKIFHNLGINKVKDIASMSVKDLEKLFGKTGIHLWQLANGIDSRKVNSDFDYQKSISREVTFNRDTDSFETLKKSLFEIIDNVSHNLRKSDMSAKTVFIKLRRSDFSTFTRSYSFNFHTDSNTVIYSECLKMLLQLMESQKDIDLKIRLIGAGVSNLILNENFEESQLDLFTNCSADKIEAKSDSIYDLLKNKYGNKVKKASMLE